MCLILFSYKNHPVYKLVVVANRDEFYSRKTAPAHFWKDNPEILGGRDLEAMGTWLAITKKGSISMITNYRDPGNIKSNAPSRGELVVDYLVRYESPLLYMEHVAKKGAVYNGFNLIVGTPDNLYYYSNYKDGVDKIVPGLHGLSNHLLDTPWPKVKNGIKKMEKLLRTSSLNGDRLLDALYDDRTAADEELPETGIGMELERSLSSMFIKSPGYGSRSSTVILIDYDNHVIFKERTYDQTSFEFSTQLFEFTIQD